MESFVTVGGKFGHPHKHSTARLNILVVGQLEPITNAVNGDDWINAHVKQLAPEVLDVAVTRFDR